MRGAVSEIHRLVRGRIVVVESVLPNGLTVSLPSRPSVLTVRFSLAPQNVTEVREGPLRLIGNQP